MEVRRPPLALLVTCLLRYVFYSVLLLSPSSEAALLSFDGCPNQIPNQTFTPRDFGRIYPTASIETAGVHFATNNADLQDVYDHAIECSAKNVRTFLPGLDCLVEGSHYGNVWLETQPMGGSMFAVRNLTLALANQLVFWRTQSKDGRLAGMVTTSAHTNHGNDDDSPFLTAVYCIGKESLLQGNYLSATAADLAFLLHRIGDPVAREYTKELHKVLEGFDLWMWVNRKSTLSGYEDILWCPSATDWGGDGYNGYQGYTQPFLSMDMMAYAHSNAMALHHTSKLLGNQTGAIYWKDKASIIMDSLERALWVPEKSACYDIDGESKRVDVLVHNNLRAMWHGVLTQSMANAFVTRHLRNASEFWTPFPLPSIAANDKMFKPGLPRNNWSGPSEGLTYQRAIRALSSYGYHVEVTLLGHKLLQVLKETPGHRFPQQWNPKIYNGTPAGAPGPGDCYGPSLLALLEYNTYARGIHLDAGRGVLLFSDATIQGATESSHSFTQTLGNRSWSLEANSSANSFRGSYNDEDTIFVATRGVRIITKWNESHDVVGVVGISPMPIDLTLSVSGSRIRGLVEPNTEYELDGSGGLKQIRQVPFIPQEEHMYVVQ